MALRRRPPRVMYNAGGIREYDEAAAHLTQEFTIAPLVAGSSAADMLVIDHARNGISDHVVVKDIHGTPKRTFVLLSLVLFVSYAVRRHILQIFKVESTCELCRPLFLNFTLVLGLDVRCIMVATLADVANLRSLSIVVLVH